jgi:aconitate hydratase
MGVQHIAGQLRAHDAIAQDHVLELKDIPGGMASGRVTVTDTTTGASFGALCSLTARQQAILMAGGLLNYTKEGGL